MDLRKIRTTVVPTVVTAVTTTLNLYLTIPNLMNHIY